MRGRALNLRRFEMRRLVFIVAGLFAMLLGTSAALAGGDAAAGEAKATTCAGCHGAQGEGAGQNPAIAGMDEAEQIAALQAYKSGERENPMMQMFAGQLSDQDMADLAAYYSGLGGK
jgi:cytochrome c553